MLVWWQDFSRRPLVAHLLRTVERFTVRGGGQFAAAIAYFSVLSLVPVLMLAFSGLGLALTVIAPQGVEIISNWLTANLSGAGEWGKKQTDALLAMITGALGNWATIGTTGLVIAFWTGANWIGNLKRASRALMREDYDNPPKQLPLPLELLVNFAALLVLFVCVAASWVATTVATVLGHQLGAWLNVADQPGWLLVIRSAGLLVSLVVGTLLFWWMFRWFAVTPVPRRLLWIGALIGALALLALQTLAGYLIGMFSKSLSAGLFGPVIVLMLFLNLFATLILYLAAWLATATSASPATARVLDAGGEPDPSGQSAAEPKPGALYVSSEVAQRSMGVGLVTGYAVGAATGLGLGAGIVAVVSRLAGRRG